MYRLNIRKLLDEKGKSQYWLSKQTGISQNNIGLIICNVLYKITLNSKNILNNYYNFYFNIYFILLW